eukprot:Colp12_sorted_trinity150504_noHs@10771
MEKKARLGLTSLQLLMARSYRSAAASSSLLAKHRKNDGSRVVDFRSDTVTVPCDGMKEAMLSAPVGDDVFEEDPTVKKLETYVADLCGKEAGLFVPSGTMANQLAVRVHVGALDSVLLDHRAHVLNWEAGGIAFHSQAMGIGVRPSGPSGHLTAADLEPQILGEDVHNAVTKLICIENTLAGSVMPLENMKGIKELAAERSLIVHLDGARLWNASVASGVSVREYAQHVDSLSLCLSKGLGAPIGSVLVGTHQLVKRAKHFRKLFGGGWRQAGILAAAGLWAIEHNWPRMAQVHTETKRLAEGLTGLGLEVVNSVETNMVFLDVGRHTPKGLTIETLVAALAAENILIAPRSATSTRMVLHHQITGDDITRTLEVIRKVLPQ